jgi:N-acetylmuramoyl-L-alanine amidase
MPRFPSPRPFALAAVLATVIAGAPVPAVAQGPPATLAAGRALGAVYGSEAPIEVDFPIDFLAVSWLDGARPDVRFRVEGSWTPWTRVLLDDVQAGPRTYGALVRAADAGAYQVRGDALGVEAMAINTTDGPRPLVWRRPETRASHLAQPPVITRALWGADENLRFNGNVEKGTRTFYPTQKLIVHHTVTANDDPDPAATIRAIYYDHVVNRDFVDIAYNFLIDAQGRIYKGRYSGPQDTKTQDTVTGENASRHGVTGAHTGGFNSGTMGIAILGNYVSTPIPAAAHQALVQHLAWEAEHHVLPPLGSGTYTNPESGVTKIAPNISGHRDWSPTQCPGETFYQALPTIRAEAAALVGNLPPPDTKPPRISQVTTRRPQRRFVIIRWRTSEPATGQAQYWEPGRRRRLSQPVDFLGRRHKIGLRPLKRDADYRYRVLSTDAAGNGTWSRVKRFSTD